MAVETIEFALEQADIEALFASKFDLLPEPESGYFYNILGCTLNIQPGEDPYAGGTFIYLVTSLELEGLIFQQEGLINSAVEKEQAMDKPSNLRTVYVTKKAVKLWCDSELTGGDGNLFVNLTFEKILGSPIPIP